MKRRDFIGISAAATMVSVLDLHESMAGALYPGSPGNEKARISELRLLSGTSPSILDQFYTQVLGLARIGISADELTIRAGETVITFIHSRQGPSAPFYHVAFNIPENKIVKALEWQRKRSLVLPTPSHMIDPGYPEAVRHFRNWNAHSVFFWDPAGNLLEYIARHDLKNSAAGNFSAADLLCVSEIAFIVNDVNSTAAEFQNSLKLKEYKQGSDDFRAVGDEMGLLLVMKQGRIWMGNTDTPKQPGIFETGVTIRSAGIPTLQLADYPYKISISS